MAQKSSIGLLIILYGSAFVGAFNENLVNVALISIMREYGIGSNTAQWLVTGYMIVTTIVVTLTAFLSKRFKLKTLFYTASALLVVGSIVCFFAPNFPVLLIFRLSAAIGTGIFIPVMMTTVLQVAPRAKMGTYLSIGNCMIVFGPAFAPVVSGLMVTSFGWRAVFIPPAILIVILALVGLKFIYNVTEPKKLKLDVLSVVLSAVGLFLFVYGLSIITDNLAIAIGALAIGLACVACFVLRQNTLEHPMLDLSPLRNSYFVCACILVVVGMMMSFSMTVLLPLYFEGALGMTSFLSGIMLLAPILMNSATSVVGGRIIDRHGAWPLLPIGFGLIALGQAAIWLLAPQMFWASILIASVVVFAGVGLIFSPTQASGLGTLSDEQSPYGVSLINTFIQMSASIGPSLFVGILSSVSANAIAAGASGAVGQADGFASAVFVATLIAIVGVALAIFHSLRLRSFKPKQQESAGKPYAMPTVDSIMKRDVYLINDDATVLDAMRSLLEHKTSGLPIVDEHSNVVGFISDGDIMKNLAVQKPSVSDLVYGLAIYHGDQEFDKRLSEVAQLNVMELANTNVLSVSADSTIEDICRLLGEKRIKKVPVVDDGVLVGTVSRSDVTRHLMGSFIDQEDELFKQ